MVGENDSQHGSATLTPVAVVTGAAAGIGRALACELARDGHALVLVDIDRAHLDASARTIEAEFGTAVTTVSLDLCSTDSARRLDETLAARGHYVDILVNNAGIGLNGRSVALECEDQLRTIDVNARALTDLTLHFLPGMVARQRGGVLNIASIAAFHPGPLMAVYAATKAYVLSFSQAIAREVKSSGVRVAVLCPGPVRTEFAMKAGMERSRMFRWLPVLPAERVAHLGYLGFKRGRTVVVPGLVNKIIASVATYMPRHVRVKAARALVVQKQGQEHSLQERLSANVVNIGASRSGASASPYLSKVSVEADHIDLVENKL